jgi:hypothetical protein
MDALVDLGRPFELVKLRTMTEARGPEGRLLPDAERLTRLGRFLRNTSLDGLPKMINVVGSFDVREGAGSANPRALLRRPVRFGRLE